MTKSKKIVYLKHILTIFLAIFFIQTSEAGEIVLTGIYKGENLYVENPYSSAGVGFCVSEILVNEFTTTDEIHSSFFEIDLSIYGFKFGDRINVTIRYKDGCQPRVLNEDVLTPFSTYKIKSIDVSKTGYIEWVTYNEHGSLPFIVEQYRWNKWITVGTVQGKGTEKPTRYQVSVNLHSGKNKFRIKQTGSKKIPNYSQIVEFENDIQEVNFIPGDMGKVSDMIFFSSFTQYEIYDYYGKRVKYGAAHDIKISDLKVGTYFLNYDNKTELFIKK